MSTGASGWRAGVGRMAPTPVLVIPAFAGITRRKDGPQISAVRAPEQFCSLLAADRDSTLPIVIMQIVTRQLSSRRASLLPKAPVDRLLLHQDKMRRTQ